MGKFSVFLSEVISIIGLRGEARAESHLLSMKSRLHGPTRWPMTRPIAGRLSARSVALSMLIILSTSLLSGCEKAQPAQSTTVPVGQQKSSSANPVSGKLKQKSIPDLPCGPNELEKFASLYASSQSTRERFTADPIIVTHLDLNTPPNATKKTVYGQARISLIAEAITPGRFSTKKVDNDHFQARKKGDSQYLHTFVNNGTCWYYTELTDKSEEACPGLSEDECERIMEPDDEGIDPE